MIEYIVLKRRFSWFGYVVRNTSTLNASYKLDFKKRDQEDTRQKRWSDGIREQCVEPLLHIERQANYEMHSATMYSRGKQKDTNLTHLSQVSHIYIPILYRLYI